MSLKDLFCNLFQDDCQIHAPPLFMHLGLPPSHYTPTVNPVSKNRISLQVFVPILTWGCLLIRAVWWSSTSDFFLQMQLSTVLSCQLPCLFGTICHSAPVEDLLLIWHLIHLLLDKALHILNFTDASFFNNGFCSLVQLWCVQFHVHSVLWPQFP